MCRVTLRIPGETDMVGANGRRSLNVGAGLDRSIQGAINIDIRVITGPDIACDIEAGLPFADNTFDDIWCKDVLEHVRDLIVVMEELHRVARDGAKLFITVPHFSCANTHIDPTHTRAFSYFTFDYFQPAHSHAYYSRARFAITWRRIRFHGSWSRELLHLPNLANKFPHTYEHHCAWLYPAFVVDYELRALKATNSLEVHPPS